LPNNTPDIWETPKRPSDVVIPKRYRQAINVVVEGGLLWIKFFNITKSAKEFDDDVECD